VLLAGATAVSDRLGASLATGPEVNQIKAALAKAAPGLPLDTLLDGVSKAVQDALDVPVADILIGACRAWDSARRSRRRGVCQRDRPRPAARSRDQLRASAICGHRGRGHAARPSRVSVKLELASRA
jgi:hypothetical protein